MRAILLLAVFPLLGGCSPGPSVSDGGPAPPQHVAVTKARPIPAAQDAAPVLRDEAVVPTALVEPIPPPKTEQQLAAEALARIGPPAVPLLSAALRGSDPDARRQALVVLLKMGPDAKEAVPDLVRLLEDDDEEIRRMAAKALGQIGPEAAEAVPALMRQMLEGNEQPVQ